MQTNVESMDSRYLTVCCIAKNEHPYIEEWVAHHLLVGAERIVVFDNESEPSLQRVLRKYIDHGLVVVHDIFGVGQQLSAYDRALEFYGPSSRWIAFIDVDEFLIPKTHSDVRFILTDYEDYGALGIHWVEFGSSGHLKRPCNSQIKNFVHRFPLHYPKNMHIKSIVQPERVKYSCSPHSFIYYPPWNCVDENFFPVVGDVAPFTAETIQLNHYFYRSQEDYCYKVERGRSDISDSNNSRNYAPFYTQLQRATIYDDSALKFSRKIAAAFDDTDSFIQRICARHREKENLDHYTDKALAYISMDMTKKARNLLKRLMVYLADRDTVNYVWFELYKQEGEYYKALEILSESFSQKMDPGLCMEYAELHLQMDNHCPCYNMLLYIRHHFSQDLDANNQYRNRFEDLWSKVQPDLEP